MTYSLKLPPVAHAGIGSLGVLRDAAVASGAKNILVCTDQGIEKSGLLDKVMEQVNGLDAAVQVLDTLTAEPSYLEVEENLNKIQGKPELIVGLGGGSVMDAAKLFSVLVGADYTIRDLLEDSTKAKKMAKTIMIPTTCGTGAEATCNAIVAVPEKSVKIGIVSSEMIPDMALLEPEMIRRLPKSIIAATGVDALAHVVECFTSNKANPFSDTFAIQGAKLILQHIVRAYTNPDDMEAKEAMMVGAYYGGVAITASGTTAVHALSYPLGGKFHIAHGVSNAILFVPVMKMNQEACQDRLAQLCEMVYEETVSMGAQERADFLIGRIGQVVRETEIPTDLSAFGVTRKDLDFLVEAGSQQKRLLNNNRKQLTLEEIRSIYEEVVR